MKNIGGISPDKRTGEAEGPKARKQQVESREEHETGEAPAADPRQPVQLQLSPAEIARIKRHLDNGPYIDNAKVEEIKRSLEDGSFRINYERLAERLIDEAQEVQAMLDSRQS